MKLDQKVRECKVQGKICVHFGEKESIVVLYAKEIQLRWRSKKWYINVRK